MNKRSIIVALLAVALGLTSCGGPSLTLAEGREKAKEIIDYQNSQGFVSPSVVSATYEHRGFQEGGGAEETTKRILTADSKRLRTYELTYVDDELMEASIAYLDGDYIYSGSKPSKGEAGTFAKLAYSKSSMSLLKLSVNYNLHIMEPGFTKSSLLSSMASTDEDAKCPKLSDEYCKYMLTTGGYSEFAMSTSSEEEGSLRWKERAVRDGKAVEEEVVWENYLVVSSNRAWTFEGEGAKNTTDKYAYSYSDDYHAYSFEELGFSEVKTGDK